MITTGVRALLLDIEGTTTPVDFVYQTLFPYAREHTRRFLDERLSEREVQADVARLRQEHQADDASGHAPPPWAETPEAATAYVHWLMDRDWPSDREAIAIKEERPNSVRAVRKSTGLKALQGRIWEEGYRRGELRSVVFEDVPRAFERWRRAGRTLAIFSSGSVLAQKLLFAHTEYGDLTSFIGGWFDTTTGPKREAESYATIASRLALPPSRLLFVSDVIAELDAARAAGLRTLLSLRGVDGPDAGHPGIHSFDEIA